MTGPKGRPGDGYILGVDLGTSHTVAMLRWPDGRTRPVLFDGQPLLPSAVYRTGSAGWKPPATTSSRPGWPV
jgi:hypothetical protein